MLEIVSVALQNSWLAVLLTAVSAYLLGSINSAVIVSRVMYKEDVREKGSGNAGATNMLRNYGKAAAAYTTVGDLLKSIIAVLLGGWLLVTLQMTDTANISIESLRVVGRYMAGMFCVLGHLYPVYFGFRGGKGVMTSLGMIIILDIRVAALCLLTFGIVVVLSRMVSLSSILAVFVAPFLVYLFGTFVDGHSALAVGFCTFMVAVIASIVIIQHRTNVVRIIKGTENKLSFNKKK